MKRALNATLASSFALLLGGVGAIAAGSKVLPTEWSLSPPPDVVVQTGTLPEGATLTADRAHLIVVEGGQGGAAIRILDPATLATEHAIALKGAYGAPLADRSGDGFWAGTGGTNTLVHVAAAGGAIERTIALRTNFWPAGIARSPDGKTLAVSGDLADAVVLIDEASGSVGTPIAVGHHPAGVAFSADGATLYVANWSESSLSVVNVATKSAGAPIAVGRHPEALALSKDGSKLFVSETDDDAIGIVATATGKRTADVNVGLYDGKLFGASPTAVALSGDGSRLFVSCSAANAIVVLKLDGVQPAVAGAIPTGWYPTAVVPDNAGNLYIVDGKGEGQRANPEFNPFGGHLRRAGYIASNTFGSVRRLRMPDDAALATGIATVRGNGGPFLTTSLGDDAARLHGPPSDEPGRRIVAAGGPIHHVIYVIKENRTYDQVLGDIAGADGDPKLTLFGKNVTPNQHALAERFGIFDNAYADAQVSADGHNWSMGAFANDYLEKMWPANYGDRRDIYDFEDGAQASVPHSAFLWNAAVRAGVSLRNYGEFVSEPDHAGGEVATQMPDLGAHTDRKFMGFDTAYRDENREAEWKREFDAYVRAGNLPALEILRLPNDHTAGTRPGARTPIAMVAENDLALGRVIDTVSHSPYWKETAIFSVEDDAQNGPDHVDAQRMPVYVVSPYANGGIQHGHYSTAGVVRTIELILGLVPMSAYDAAARPMYAAFTARADLRPYDTLPESVDLEAKNSAAAYRARDSARADLSHEDAVPPAMLNDIVWHAVRGARATPPPYGEFER